MRKLTLKEMQDTALARGGKCLSKKYVNSRTKLRWRCKEGHIWEAYPAAIKQGSWCLTCGNAKMGERRKLTIEEMQDIARERGGKCLSKKYVNSWTKLRWKCKEGHIWEAAPNNIKRGTWCQVCNSNKIGVKNRNAQRLTIEEMQEIAKSKGGKCLSKKYVNSLTKLKWMCGEGHVWEAIPSSIKQGTWCPVCNNAKKREELKLTIEEMQDIAKSRGGKCLSKKYVNSWTKLRWKCKEGHIWEATPNNIKRGSWCSLCKYNKIRDTRRLTIKEMQNIAKKKGGKCLSKEYVNIRTELKWKCKEGHVWEDTPYNVKRGSWCPICGHIKAADARRMTIKEM